MMPGESVIRIGCLSITEHFIAGVTQERLEKKDVEFSNFAMHLVVMNAFEQISDRLLKGEIDGAFLPLPVAMELFRTGLKIRLLLFANRGGSVFIKNNYASIKHMEDFKNKTILTPCLLSVQNMLLHKMFFSTGLKLGNSRDNKADVLLEVVPSNIAAEVVENDSDNDIGGFVAPALFGLQAIKAGNCKEVCKFESLWQDYPDNVFVLKDSILNNNREYVQELVSAFIEAGEIIDKSDYDYLAPYAEAFLMKDNNFTIDHEIVHDLFIRIKGMFASEKLSPDYSVMEIVQDYMVDQFGFMAEKIDIRKFIDTSFTEKLRRN